MHTHITLIKGQPFKLVQINKDESYYQQNR